MIDLPVVRLFATPGQAHRALDALRRWGFEPDSIVVIPPSIRAAGEPGAAAATSGLDPGNDARAAALDAAGVPRSHAARYADAIRRGHTLVSVRAPFGTGGIAEDMLEAGEPVVLDSAPFHASMLPSDLAAPLSSTLGLATLTRRGRTTSEALGLPAVTGRGGTTSEALGLATVTGQGRTTSEALGLSTLASPDHYTFGAPRVSDSAAPFSKMLGLPVLVRSRNARDAAR